MTDLKNELPSDIVLEFSANTEQLIDALGCTDHSDEMIELLLTCLSKACQYTSLRQKVLEILVMVEDSQFFKMTILKFITKIKSLPESDVEEYENSILYLLKICKEIKARIPSSMFHIIGISTILGKIISKLSNSDRTTTEELILAYKLLEDSTEDTMEEMNKEVRPKYSRPVMDNNLQPPQDFQEIPVFPEMHDIHVDVFPFLRQNKIFGGYENLQHYLDVQFRLLREDFIGPLRDGIHDYIESLQNKGKGCKTKDIRVYTDVQMISSVCNSSGLCKRVSFSCSGFKRIRWESSKRLLFGSLVCLSIDNFDTLLFATVGNRDLKDLKRGLVDLKFEDTNQIGMMPDGSVFVMAESSAFFEAYKHVLTGLKTMTTGDLPFERYIVFCESDIEAPAYIRRNPRARYDLRPLVDDSFTIRDRSSNLGHRPVYQFSHESEPANRVNVTSLQRWPNPELLQLDDSQFNAVQMALSKEFAIVQGPPGTGKTYIGLKIVKALLHNKSIWNPDENNRSPLMVVCYTNHALDQFLEGILSFFTGDVLRLGSRSSSEIMKQYNINSKRTALRRDRKSSVALHRERVKARVHMNKLKEAINKISQRIEIAKKEVLHEETLQTVIDQQLWFQMMQVHQLLVQEMIVHGFEASKGKKECALLEWLGYGNLTCGQQTLHLPSISTTNGVFMENNSEDEDNDEDNFIDAVDEVNGQMQQRLMDIHDNDDDDIYEEIDEDGAINEITNLLENMGLTKDTVALDVSSLGTKQSTTTTDDWQINAKQRKQIKRTIRRELASNDNMTRRDVTRISNIWKLEQKDRWRLYRYWVHHYCMILQEQIVEREEEFQQACDLVGEMQMQEDKGIMRHSTVIGLTTTCAARYQSVLKEIGPKIIVVEEAAEVLEAHVITTLSKQCEHLILIGDHKQLKPNPTVYKLARDYKLEISLFERLINNELAYRCLGLQHRMRPEISRIMKIIYPKLSDHDVVKTYEPVKGVSQNAFFIDHSELESSDDDIKSHCNIHEADYMVALCRYLLLQGYKPEQITVLTLYSAQLFQLKQRMPRSDFNGVHLTVVDNYQGEENDIILLSLVRSNLRNNLGFLKIENRICVALSRARKGLFVIGNFGMLEQERKNNKWKEIVGLARKENMIGKSLLLYCQNHPTDKGITATTANDFKKAPEGGCMKPCEFKLRCGHVCTRACHIYDRKHKEFVCMKPCQKTVCNLGHKCTGICSKKCSKCKIPVPKIIPGCGHEQNVPCSQDPSNWVCTDRCKVILECGHTCKNPCGNNHTDSCQDEIIKTWSCGHSAIVKCFKQDGECPSPCKQMLECEHECKGTCGSCFRGKLHKSCNKQCRRPLVCEHLCKDKICSNCPPCTRRCQNRCVHSSCQKFCGDVCIPCAEPCEWQCEHHSCNKICSEPCKRPRCDEPCKKQLECGHRCIGLCGEPCPNVCRVCNKEIVQEIFFGTEDESDARFVQLQDCKHFFEVCGIDKWMDEHIESDEKMTSIKLKECPKCKTPIRRNLRYGNMIKQALHDIENVKRQIMGDDARIKVLHQSIRQGIVKLSDHDRIILKQHMEKMARGPVSVQSFATIENQVRFLSKLMEMKDKYERDTEVIRQFASIGYGINIRRLHDFIIHERKYFTKQEITDIFDELDRLKMLLQFLKTKVHMKKRGIKFNDRMQKDVDRVERYLTDGNRLLERRRVFVQNTMEIVESQVPISGLGISDEERLQIVKAMDLSKGHWYKCHKGLYQFICMGFRNRKKIEPLANFSGLFRRKSKCICVIKYLFLT